MPVQRETISAISSSVTSSRRSWPPDFCFSASWRFPLPELGFELGEPAVAQLGALVEVVLPLGGLDLLAHLLDLLPQGADLLDRPLLGLPLRPHGVGLGLQVRQLAAEVLQPLLARLVLLLLEGRLLDLELHDAAGHLVELLGHGVDLGAEHGRRPRR